MCIIILEDILKKKILFNTVLFFIAVLCFSPVLSAQSDIKSSVNPDSAASAEALPTETSTEAAAGELSPLPFGYNEIKLGMDLDTVKKTLYADPNFNYRGDPDVTMLPQDKQYFIECDGNVFIDRAFFQFEDEKLYIIIIMMNQEMIDHYSIYSAFVKKYGLPDSLDPSSAQWKDDKVIISLERPLTLKYMDKEVFEKQQENSKAESTMESVLRSDFIDTF